MNRNKVSVLIPFYNAEPHLARTIQSALNQTYSNIEIILVDDGSTDGSLSIARSFASESVKIFPQKNGGACRARNKAFQESSGSYIQYLDGDDLLSADKIQKQMELVRDEDATIIGGRFVRFYDDKFLPSPPPQKGFLERSWANPFQWLIHECEGMGMTANSSWLTPRSLIGKAGPWNENLSINQDGEFFCRVLLHANEIRFCESALVYYRSGNQNSISQGLSEKKIFDLLLSYKLYEEHMLRNEDSLRVREALAKKYASFIYAHFDRYPAAVQKARDYIISLGIKRIPEMGGRNFKLLAMFAGFENALKLRAMMRRFT